MSDTPSSQSENKNDNLIHEENLDEDSMANPGGQPMNAPHPYQIEEVSLKHLLIDIYIELFGNFDDITTSKKDEFDSFVRTIINIEELECTSRQAIANLHSTSFYLRGEKEREKIVKRG